jgi:uncharacterized protein
MIQPNASNGSPALPHIVETIVTTRNADGTAYLAPLGLIADGARWIIAPFQPSRTLQNLRAHPFACASHTTDVRVFAGGVTGRKTWPTIPATTVDTARLADCTAHWELAVDDVIEDPQRPRFVCRVISEHAHKPWTGHNRAQAAVIEGAVLVSRLHMLPGDKIDAELRYLEIAISKTAGPVELEAWGWLIDAITAWRTKQGSKS